MKLKPAAKSPLAQALKAPTAASGESAHFGRSADFRQMFEVDLDRVHPRADQPRKHFDEGELQALAASIAARGVLQPILVRKRDGSDDTYEIVAGERRWRASRLAGRDRVRAVLVDGSAAEIALIENMQRVDLTPLEEADGIQALIDAHGYSQGQVADALGRSRVRVNETLRLLDLLPEIRACLTSDTTVPRTTLLQIARAETPEEQRRLWAQARQGAGEKAVRAARAAHGAPVPASRLLRDVTRTMRTLETLPAPALDDRTREMLRGLRDRLSALLD